MGATGKYASSQQRDVLRQAFQKAGCHSCGAHCLDRQVAVPTRLRVYRAALLQRGARSSSGNHSAARAGRRVGQFVADHQPPNHNVKLALEARGVQGWLLRRWPSALAQKFYPQCRQCSQLQAAAVRTKTRVLVFQRWLFRQRQVLLGGAAIGYLNSS